MDNKIAFVNYDDDTNRIIEQSEKDGMRLRVLAELDQLKRIDSAITHFVSKEDLESAEKMVKYRFLFIDLINTKILVRRWELIIDNVDGHI